jgi:hypothetical protein
MRFAKLLIVLVAGAASAHARRSVAVVRTVTTAFVKQGDRAPRSRTMTIATHRAPTRYARAWGARDLPATDRQGRSGHCEPEDETGTERPVGLREVGAYQTPPG